MRFSSPLPSFATPDPPLLSPPTTDKLSFLFSLAFKIPLFSLSLSTLLFPPLSIAAETFCVHRATVQHHVPIAPNLHPSARTSEASPSASPEHHAQYRYSPSLPHSPSPPHLFYFLPLIIHPQQSHHSPGPATDPEQVRRVCHCSSKGTPLILISRAVSLNPLHSAPGRLPRTRAIAVDGWTRNVELEKPPSSKTKGQLNKDYHLSNPS